MYILKTLGETKSAEQLSYGFKNFEKFGTVPTKSKIATFRDFLNFAYQLDDYKR